MTYDRYGNRTAQTVTAGTGPSNSVSVDATTNRIVGLGYDANGNMTNDGSNTLVYDGENRALSATNGSTSGTYAYDGNGLRVTKVAGGTTTVYVFSGGKVIAEYDNGAGVASPSREYIYSGAQLLAKIESGGTTYYHADHLSARLLTDSSGNTLGQRGHFPFGETWYETGTTTKFKFTTYEHDGESSNDYALARYNINRLGRFSSPDPIAGSVGDPQSLNRYPYGRLNPINLVDPLGMDDCLPQNFVCDSGGASIDLMTDPAAIIRVTVSEPMDTGTLDPSFNPGYADPSVGNGESGGGGSQGHGDAVNSDRIATVKALARYKILFNEKCRDFIQKLLTFLYGGPATAVDIANRLDQATFTSSSTPSVQYPTALAQTTHGSYSATVYPGGASQTNQDLAVTFIHETFHMGPRARNDIQMWQASIGNHNISLANTPQNVLGASSSWNQKLMENCK